MQRPLLLPALLSVAVLPWAVGEEAILQSPLPDDPIRLEAPAPAAVKKTRPPDRPSAAMPSPEEPLPSLPERILFQLRDHHWQQNVHWRIGTFTILGYREAGHNERMLFRFLTPEEHAAKRVMNSRASLLHAPPRPKPAPPRGGNPPG